MHEVDRAIIAAVAAQGVDMHEGDVPTEQDAMNPDVRVITVGFPYAVLFSNFGDDNAPRLSGRSSQRSVFFQVTYVGLSMDQAKWVGRRQRAALGDKRLTVYRDDPATGEQTTATYRTGLISVDESQRVRADHEATDPEGQPVFFGVDTYSMNVSLTH